MDLKILFQPSTNRTGYNRLLPATNQPPHIPRTFLDAMSIRESVFVHEQKVPLSLEADSDDSRSCHWVAYLSSKPVGTVRIVPFPQDLHPLPGSAWDLPEDDSGEPVLEVVEKGFRVDRATSLHDGREAYVKFGRWAVIKEARGMGISTKLIEAVEEWLRQNPKFFDVDVEGVSRNQSHWNGLMCAHAQKYVAGAWQRMGFVIDEIMSEWSEADIPHVGVWKRLKLEEA